MSDLRLVRGDTYNLPFSVVDSSGTAVNLTGYTVYFTAKYLTSDLDAAAVFAFTTSSGITITNAAAGTGTIDITASNWSTYTTLDRNLVWDLQVKDGSGNVTTVDSGRIFVEQDVTSTS